MGLFLVFLFFLLQIYIIARNTNQRELVEKTLFFCFIFSSIACNDGAPKSNAITPYISAIIETQTFSPTVPLPMSAEENQDYVQGLELCLSECNQSDTASFCREAAPICGLLCCGSIVVGVCIPTLPFAVIECLKCLGLTTL